MSQVTSQIENYLDENRQRFENDLVEWLKMPSVSTDSAFKDDVRKAGQWLVDKLSGSGFSTELIETKGHPIVYAESPKIEGAPTVLVYGHYDVQPPDPLELWNSPPFEPVVHDRKVYARGATDDKGQLITHVFSAEAWNNCEGNLPVQLKFLIEGEEECGSKALYEFLDGKYDGDGPSVNERLQADICVISDGSQYDHGKPAITYGLRGIAYFELLVQGPNRDLHSGAHGGAVTNPANTLCQMIASLKDDQGRIQIPGFYDDVIELTQVEKTEFTKLDFDDEDYKDELGVDGLTGEQGFSTLERRWARPTCDVNGLWSGYQGEGAKTVLPEKAGVKISFRLVPNQDPKKVANALESYLESQCPAGIEFELIDMHGAPGVLVPIDNPYMAAARQAIDRGFGTEACFIRTGGSIPVVLKFKESLGIDTLLVGWGQDDDNPHSPNEKFSLDDFHKGIKASACLWEEIANVQK